MRTLRKTCWAGLLAIATFGAIPTGGATAGVEDLVEDAREHHMAGRIDEAATTFAKAVAAAQKKGDLPAELHAGRAMNTLFEAPAVTSGTAAIVSRGGLVQMSSEDRHLLAVILRELDATRNGAVVSAPVIARQLLLAATEMGDTEYVTGARAALEENAKSKHSGRATAVLLRYAEGLGVRESDAEKAAQHFDAAYSAAVAEGWRDLAVFIGTERAALRFEAEDVDGARETLSDVGKMAGRELPARLVTSWRRAVAARMPDAPDTLMKVLADATSTPLPAVADPVVSEAGLGRAKLTDLGRALKKGSKKKVLVEVTRTSSGHDVACRFDPKTELVRFRNPDEQRVDLGGFVLKLRGTRVAVFDLRTEHELSRGLGNVHAWVPRGGIGALLRAEYLLGEGETWRVTKGGEVEISE